MHRSHFPFSALTRATLTTSLLFGALLVFESAVAVGQIQDVTLSVSPTLPDRGESLVVSVDATGSCTYLKSPLVVDHTVTIEAVTTNCPVPPGPYLAYAVVPPLDVGTYTIELLDEAMQILDAIEVTVYDPDWDVAADIDPLGVPRTLRLDASGIGSCIFEQAPTVEGNRIVWKLFRAGICDPPPPIRPLTWTDSVGPLDPDVYTVELQLDELIVAIDQFTVQPTFPCVSSQNTLCLDGRFEVSVFYQVPGGPPTPAVAEAVRDDSGFFWFFGPDNIELLVKVHDACGTIWDSYWVFASGLTDVAVDLRVRDTLTGAEKVYTNPYGREFVPILDTVGLDVCL